jgi:hypothetical protein
MNTLGMIALVVDDYDLAIAHYVNDLGFSLIEDTVMSPEKRWVVVAPSNEGAKILLAKAATDQQRAAIGNSTGGRVGFFMYTTNFVGTYELNLLKNPAKRPMVKWLSSKTNMATSGISLNRSHHDRCLLLAH